MFEPSNLLFITLAPVFAYTAGALAFGLYQYFSNAPTLPVSTNQIS